MRDVACGVSLAGGDVGERVLDLHALAKVLPSSCGVLKTTEFLLQPLVVSN